MFPDDAEVQGGEGRDVRPVRVFRAALEGRPAEEGLQGAARQGLVPHPLPLARAERRPEDARDAADDRQTGGRGHDGGALRRPRRHLGREEGDLPNVDEDRPAGVPAMAPPVPDFVSSDCALAATTSCRAWRTTAPRRLRCATPSASCARRTGSTSDGDHPLEPSHAGGVRQVRKANQIEVIAHRKLRTVRLGEHLSVQFEDERRSGARSRRCCTSRRSSTTPASRARSRPMCCSFPTAAGRGRRQIEVFRTIEARKPAGALIAVQDRASSMRSRGTPVSTIARRGLDRENDENTSAVHFLRFELRRRRAARFAPVRASGSAATTRTIRRIPTSRRRRSRALAGTCAEPRHANRFLGVFNWFMVNR